MEWLGAEGSLELWTLERDHTRYVTLGRGCGRLVFSLGHAGYSWRQKFSWKTAVEGWVVGLFTICLRAGLLPVCILPLADALEGHHSPHGPKGAQHLEADCPCALYPPTGISISLVWVAFVPAQLPGTTLMVGQHPALVRANLTQSTEGRQGMTAGGSISPACLSLEAPQG